MMCVMMGANGSVRPLRRGFRTDRIVGTPAVEAGFGPFSAKIAAVPHALHHCGVAGRYGVLG